MRLWVKKLLLIEIYLFSIFSGQNVFVKEFCISETFKAKCLVNEVILINNAKYGRTNIGKCISEEEIESFEENKKNIKYFGCFKSVTEELNRKCKLNTSCEVKVTDFEKKNENFCQLGLNKHLEVNYSCLKIFKDNGDCRLVANNKPVYLEPNSMKKNEKGNCFNVERPLIIETVKGQKIKFTIRLIYNFEKNKEKIQFHNKAILGYIVGDKKTTFNASSQDNSFEFTTEKTKVTEITKEIETNDHRLTLYFTYLKKDFEFLIGIEADGCSDIIPHEDWWMKRDNDDLVVGCYSSQQKWYLRCQNRQWKGVLGNCSMFHGNKNVDLEDHYFDQKNQVEEPDSFMAKYKTLVLVGICGFGVIVCVLILCLGAICLKSNKETKKNLNYNSMPIYQQHQQQLAMMTFRQQQQAQEQRMDYSACEEDRYQVLDQDEVAKQEALVA